MANEKINNIAKNLKEVIGDDIGITEQEVIDIINNILLNQVVGNNSNLNTNAKDLVVNAINELVTKSNNLENSVNEAFQLGNDVKEMLVETLIAKGIIDASTSDTFTTLISYLDLFSSKKDFNVYEFTIDDWIVNQNGQVYLENDLRGDTFSGTVLTDWGDGTIDRNTTHVYKNAGVYRVKTKYYAYPNKELHALQMSSVITNVFNINKNMKDASHLFYKCTELTVIDASDWDTSNIEKMDWMFGECSKLREIDTSNWDVHNVRSAANMFTSCQLLRDNDEDN